MRYSTILKELSIFKTLKVNFKYFKFRDAIRLPVLISRHVRIRSLKGNIICEKIRTGIVRLGFDSVGIFDNKKSRSILEIYNNGTLYFGGKALMGNGFKLSIGGGELSIGDGFTLSAESTIICNKKISIGPQVLISWDVLVMDTDFHKIYTNDKRQINHDVDIEISEHAWIGCRTTVLKGSVIPMNSIIGAGSLISSKLGIPNAIYAGNPPKLLKENINWER